MTTRRTFLFDVSEVDFAQIGQIAVEQFIDEHGDTTEIALAVRTDDRDTWSPPTIGRQTS